MIDLGSDEAKLCPGVMDEIYGSLWSEIDVAIILTEGNRLLFDCIMMSQYLYYNIRNEYFDCPGFEYWDHFNGNEWIYD